MITATNKTAKRRRATLSRGCDHRSPGQSTPEDKQHQSVLVAQVRPMIAGLSGNQYPEPFPPRSSSARSLFTASCVVGSAAGSTLVGISGASRGLRRISSDSSGSSGRFRAISGPQIQGISGPSGVLQGPQGWWLNQRWATATKPRPSRFLRGMFRGVFGRFQ